jgi:hypothetical protein
MQTRGTPASAFWPFTYETSVARIEETLERYDQQLGVCRRALAWALRNSPASANGHRRQIDRLEAAKRNGAARIRQLTPPPVAEGAGEFLLMAAE